MNQTQERIKKFNLEREWGGMRELKDSLLNMTEEIGEFWNLVKWVDIPTQEKMIRENKEEAENFIGDMLYLILKISFMSNVDPQKAIDDVMEEYEKRFPLDQTKGRHGNLKAGGIDLKHQKK